MSEEHGWREIASGRWLAWHGALEPGEYRLQPRAGFREWATRSVLWDCPHCERRVLLHGTWLDFPDDGYILVGWRGECQCGADVSIALNGIPDDTHRRSVHRR